LCSQQFNKKNQRPQTINKDQKHQNFKDIKKASIYIKKFIKRKTCFVVFEAIFPQQSKLVMFTKIVEKEKGPSKRKNNMIMERKFRNTIRKSQVKHDTSPT